MRSWAKPRWFKDPNYDLLLAYRVLAPIGNQREVPPGWYIVIHVQTDNFNVRTVVGPMTEERTEKLMETVTLGELLAILEYLEKQVESRQKSTLH